jgi:transposase
MAAITQIRHKHSQGRGYDDRKIAAGKTHKEALRCLKRRISDAIYARLRAAARTTGEENPNSHLTTTTTKRIRSARGPALNGMTRTACRSG